jgi:adenylate cyclase
LLLAKTLVDAHTQVSIDDTPVAPFEAVVLLVSLAPAGDTHPMATAPMTPGAQRIPISRPGARGLLRGVYEAGQEISVTMMFIDVRSFTRLSRDRCPHQVVDALNKLFGLVAPVIAAHGGHIEKFIGDGLMAVFGMPASADHADRALQAARAIEARVGERLHGWIDIGIGLDSGKVLVALLGAGGRVEMTLVGHAVNMAAHVEAATRRTHDTILLTDRTKALLQRSWPDLEPRVLPLSGEPGPALLYAPGERQARDD